MSVINRTIAIQLVRSISKLGKVLSKRSVEKWLREQMEFDWMYCRVCDSFKPPKYFYKSEKSRCCTCTSLVKQRQYWRDPEKAREVARKSKEKYPRKVLRMSPRRGEFTKKGQPRK